ncbi:hypothetical protein [Archaeoglobus veneficus]|uniref:Uncharacterized protein n=1 Tax=Archaeoglobus veneficus (strain DSM 11195 / SNP6) TaxID=693661 RepID=F2KQ92_ARCVS|nr:hypothetical protein [Archaeoglobus veneficus]AEA46525.1 hypothetical protein Arcve_0498 [Archaeoglobus veneficus SNP6]
MQETDIKVTITKTIQRRIEEINRTLQELSKNIEYFEKKYGMKTDEFYDRFVKGELGDEMDFFEWKSSKDLYDELKKEKELLLRAIV